MLFDGGVCKSTLFLNYTTVEEIEENQIERETEEAER